jgi:hypothetical protein
MIHQDDNVAKKIKTIKTTIEKIKVLIILNGDIAFATRLVYDNTGTFNSLLLY